MKISKYLLIISVIIMTSCHKDDDPIAPIDQLPPATQSGAGTFGCLVNGKAFIDNSGFFNCFYQFVDGEYYFGIGGNDDGLNPQYIYLYTQKKELIEGNTYIFLEIDDGNAYAGGGFSLSPTESYQSYTNSLYTGELTITKLDFENYIVSGTFSFDLLNPINGEIMEIREGRFDSHFTQ